MYQATHAAARGRLNPRCQRPLALALAMLWLCATCATVRAQEPGQKTFASPQAAAQALVDAMKKNDQQEELAILGNSAQELISSGDPVQDRNSAARFIKKYQEMHRFVTTGNGRVFLYTGAENWPVPIPLQKQGSQWYFDTEYGKQEALYRRIGHNELTAMKVCKAIVEAQEDYYGVPHDGDSIQQYAQRFMSTPGKHDGLYWKTAQGEPDSPIGPLVARAARQGYRSHHRGQPAPFHGYIFKILTSQGADAKGGAKNYISDGRMVHGFAVMAYPANYRVSGVMTFMVGQDGKIYQKDLGPDTEQVAAKINAYDPESTWQPIDESEVAM